jgi:mannose-6-phosphate isomerase-like protein (cupin superfamily)
MPVNVKEVAANLREPWKPVVAAEANGFQSKVARLEGEFPWHAHEAEDELFHCFTGSFRIENEADAPVTLYAGDIHVVPAGTRPYRRRGKKSLPADQPVRAARRSDRSDHGT